MRIDFAFYHEIKRSLIAPEQYFLVYEVGNMFRTCERLMGWWNYILRQMILCSDCIPVKKYANCFVCKVNSNLHRKVIQICTICACFMTFSDHYAMTEVIVS